MRHLFYVSQLYSLAILRPLQQAARAQGDECAWFFDRPEAGVEHLKDDETLLESVKAVMSFNPDTVYAPGNVVPDFFPGIKVQVFHGLATDDTGKKGHYRIRGFFDLYCTRGDEETLKFQALAEHYGHFRVAQTGWPKLDPLFSGESSRALRSELGIEAERPVVLYGSTFSPSLTSAPELFETIARLSRHREWYWLLTLHPKHDPRLVQKYRDLAGPNVAFFESHEDIIPLLRCADVMLCDTSSIAIEFQMLQKPLVTFRAKCPGPQQIDVQMVGDIEGAITKALSRPADLMEATCKFAHGLHPRADGKSSQRVLEAVEGFATQGVGGLRPNPLEFLPGGQRRRLGCCLASK